LRAHVRSGAVFRQHDVTRALRAVAAAGIEAARVEIDPSGRIVIELRSAGRPEPANELDKWMADHADQA
jgi:hypothetical protein